MFQTFNIGVNSPTSSLPQNLGSVLARAEESFSLPSEVSEIISEFNPDLGLEQNLGLTEGSLPKRELLGEARLKAEKYGYVYDDPEWDRRVNAGHRHISAEVGDDEIDVSNNIAYTSLLSVFHRRLCMKESVEDTSINSRYGNFAEDLVIMPDSYYQTYHNCRNTGNWNDMSYIDVCKIRLATDIRPMRMTHSGTNDGKASMVGKRQSWIPPGRLRLRYDVFSLFQDIHLGIHRDKKFAYLPEALGGYGKRLPFDNADNMERFIKAFRQGTHQRLVRTIVRRACNWYDDYRDLKNPPPDDLLRFVARFTSSWHDWIKGQSIYSPVTWIDIPPELAGKAVDLNPRDPFERDVISRLISDKRLVTESQVQIVHEHNENCKGLLQAENFLVFKGKLEAKRKEWLRNSSIFSMEAYGYIKELTVENEGYRPLIRMEVQNFQSLIDDQSMFNLKLQLREEKVYLQDTIDELYKCGPMKAHFSMFPRYKGHTVFAHQNLRANIIDTEQLDQISDLEAWVRAGKQGPAPRVMLNDDNSIIRDIGLSNLGYYCIVTDDRHLCRVANIKTGKPIFRVPVEWYYRSLYFGDADEPWLKFIQRRTGFEWGSLCDTGSITSFEEKFFKDGAMLKKQARNRFSLLRPKRWSTPVEVEESENFSDGPPDERPDTFLYDRKRVLGWVPSKAPAKIMATK